ncbi:MAG: hypothetical protein UT05_C0007G0012 [Parcubacteria group bacterium GW2011_GWF2_38_76]|nr:MAG: hypothetical protein UT05_C0007G0012 [Parcubacteria group bacterium GW2011_GWF2_38_76]
MKHCIHCGEQIPDNAIFCPSCGEKIKDENTKQKKQINENTLKKEVDTPKVLSKLRTYKILKDLKSTKWNSFLVHSSDLEEYLVDGDKEKRRNEILKLRECIIPGEYIKHNQTKPDKGIIYTITGKNKGLFGRDLSSYFMGVKDNDQNFKDLINAEKEESGEIVSFFPSLSNSVLFVTTKGLCFIEEKSEITTPSTILFGVIGGVVVDALMNEASRKLSKTKVSKLQQKIIEQAYKYSPCLTARSYKDCQFIPYELINLLVYAKEDGKIDVYFQNDKKISFHIDNGQTHEFIKTLSGDKPPVAGDE